MSQEKEDEIKQQQDAERANRALVKVTIVLAKVAEVLHWCVAGVMLAVAIAALFQPAPLADFLKSNVLNGETSLSCYGLEMKVADTEGAPQFGLLFGFGLGSAVVLSLMAMIFRDIYLILKTAQGKTWFAKGSTPFQQNTVRMFREIGIFFIIISAMSLVSTTVMSAMGGEIVSGFNYLSGFMGLVFLCISQFFKYGTGLEEDLDGLV